LRDLHRAFWFERCVNGRWTGRRRLLLEAHVGRIEPADDRLEPEQLGVAEPDFRSSLPAPTRVALHDLDHVPTIPADLVDVDPRNLESDEHLDHELVARGRHEVRRGTKPVGQLAIARRRDPVALLRAGGFPVVGLDEPVALEAPERCIDLAYVERPDFAGPRLELRLQPRPTSAFTEEGEKRMTLMNCSRIGIPSMYTGIGC
jgi:hypothetical protein